MLNPPSRDPYSTGARVTVGNNNDSLDTLCGVLSFNSLVNYKQVKSRKIIRWFNVSSPS